jgi:hypothetical protein
MGVDRMAGSLKALRIAGRVLADRKSGWQTN